MRTRFEVDDDHDQTHATDEVSRYGAYLRQDFDRWAEDAWGCVEDGRVDTSHNEWLIWTWNRATGPVMSPSYVDRPGHVRSAWLEVSDYDGKLLATLEVCAPLPVNLGWRWRSWDLDALDDRLIAPDQLPAALTTVTLTAPLEGPWDGPTIRATFGDAIVRSAQGAVRHTCDRINETFGEVLDQLRTGSNR
jgi:hypothetical protein